MNSAGNTPYGVGCPIRTFSDQSLLATPRNLSQRATSFIASQCQGIHQMLLSCLILIRSQICLVRTSSPETRQGRGFNLDRGADMQMLLHLRDGSTNRDILPTVSSTLSVALIFGRSWRDADKTLTFISYQLTRLSPRALAHARRHRINRCQSQILFTCPRTSTQVARNFGPTLETLIITKAGGADRD